MTTTAAPAAVVPAGRVYGTLTYVPNPAPTPGGAWLIAAEPHVVIRARRLFDRVKSTRDGALVVTDSADVAHDLAWFTTRYPLTLDPRSAAHLANQVGAYKDREAAVLRILAGQGERPRHWREPAREPRPGQSLIAELVHATGRLLCTDPLGAGKSMSGALVLANPDALPALVVTLNGKMLEQWCTEIEKTLPGLVTHIAAKGQPYDIPAAGRRLRPPADPAQLTLGTLPGDSPLPPDLDALPDVLVMNYAKLYGWAPYLAGLVKTVIFDEVQELRHADSNRYLAAAHIAGRADYRLGLSNTPIYNYGGEAYNVLDVLDRGCLGTRAEYSREWCNMTVNGKTAVRDPAAFRAYLGEVGILLGRTRAELGIELPPTEPVVHEVECDREVLGQIAGNATAMAKLLLDRNSAPRTRFTTAGEFDMMLRQSTGLAKAPYVAEYVRLLLATEPGPRPKVLLYGWHHAVYDVWREMLADLHPVQYTGQESNPAKKRAFRDFVEGDAQVCLMSLRSGAGLDGLQAVCHHVVFGELDWSPSVFTQCIGRLERGGMDLTRPVRAHWLVANEGSDPTMAAVLNLKRMQTEGIFDPSFTQVTEIGDTTARVRRLALDHLARVGEAIPDHTTGDQP